MLKPAADNVDEVLVSEVLLKHCIYPAIIKAKEFFINKVKNNMMCVEKINIGEREIVTKRTPPDNNNNSTNNNSSIVTQQLSLPSTIPDDSHLVVISQEIDGEQMNIIHVDDGTEEDPFIFSIQQQEFHCENNENSSISIPEEEAHSQSQTNIAALNRDNNNITINAQQDITEIDLTLDDNCTNKNENLRMVLIFDGEQFQLRSALNLFEESNDNGLELLKLPAATSLSFQPNDVMPSFRILKTFVRSRAFKTMNYQKATEPPYCLQLQDIFTQFNFEPSSKKTFMNFFRFLPDMLHAGYSGKHIREGWRKTGIFPLNIDTILRHHPGYQQELNKNEAESILRAIPELGHIARLEGRVPDKAMVDKIGTLYHGDGEDTRNYETCPLNYMRSLWINHEKITRMHKDKIAAKMKTNSSSSNTTTSTSNPSNNSNNGTLIATNTNKKRKLKDTCSVTSCCREILLNESTHYSICKNRGCNKIFCGECVVAKLYDDHIDKCPKRKKTTLAKSTKGTSKK